ncbi:MAG: carbohydrate ABC transporter substrate-binding protein [Chloroflexi bacterium]|nr:carbohydrate ABC transporter substrate-binding protein [Chloroflexota bacterium]MDL1884442.1 carbohydrate ABC transporter substrate-binding protein [Anaerolineae bacterium CFX8]
MFKRFSLIMVVLLLIVGSAYAQGTGPECFGSEGSALSILGSWAGEEEETFRQVIAPVIEACNLTLSYEGTRDLNTVLPTRVDGGAPPDIALLPNPGAIKTFANNLVALTDVGVNPDSYSEGWQQLGSVDGRWLGLPLKTDVKSLVWYSPVAFEAAGYSVPATWDEFIALMDQMVADGGPAPLAMGFESGGATGWTATDFVQDILLRTQGLEYVNGLVSGETAWNDQGVVDAWTLYVEWVNKYGAGGADGALTTSFGDAILQPFQDPAAAWMVKQSGFAGSAFIQPNFPDYVYGEDFAFFVLPTADGEPAAMQVGGDFLGVFNDTPAVNAMIAYLSSADGASAWAASGFDLTPNSAVDLGAYANPISADKAAALLSAPDVSFDVGDLMPPAVGQAEFDNIKAAVGGGDIVALLNEIQAKYEEATGM